MKPIKEKSLSHKKQVSKVSSNVSTAKKMPQVSTASSGIKSFLKAALPLT
jgi:hypothetical protein